MSEDPQHPNGPGTPDGADAPTPDAGVVAAAAQALDADRTVVAPDAGVAAALRAAGVRAEHAPLDGRRDLDAIALLADELDGAEPEGLIAGAADALRPGGLLAVSSRNGVHGRALGASGDDGRADHELVRALGHRGFAVELLAAPGAAARLRGEDLSGEGGDYDPDLDRLPSLLGAAPRLVAVGRLADDQRGRSARFFQTLPRKVVSAAVLCREPGGRVLVVHDSFKQHWTIPGGVVDADEDPRRGAAREAFEEAGVRVEVGAVLGVFFGTWPDRLMFVYAAVPVGDEPGEPRPQHPHEIDDARWVDLDDALAMVAPFVRDQIERCIGDPGRSWAD